jgi:hypothetical protein
MTETGKMSLISYNVPGPWVAMKGDDFLGETHDHVGIWQALVGLYGGSDIMAVTYRDGVSADSDNLTLPTLRSDATSAGTQIYFVSLDDRLGIGELANGTPTASSTNAAVTSGGITAVSETTAAMSTNDGTVVAPIGRAIEFRVTLPATKFANVTAPILIHYPTDDSNARNVTVYLPIEFNS